MRNRRYEIQFAYIEDTLNRDQETPWYSRRTGSSKIRRRAVANWWEVVNNNQQLKIYRLVDTKTGKVIR